VSRVGELPFLIIISEEVCLSRKSEDAGEFHNWSENEIGKRNK
jgi:hypothetical protein